MENSNKLELFNKLQSTNNTTKNGIVSKLIELCESKQQFQSIVQIEIGINGKKSQNSREQFPRKIRSILRELMEYNSLVLPNGIQVATIPLELAQKNYGIQGEIKIQKNSNKDYFAIILNENSTKKIDTKKSIK